MVNVVVNLIFYKVLYCKVLVVRYLHTDWLCQRNLKKASTREDLHSGLGEDAVASVEIARTGLLKFDSNVISPSSHRTIPFFQQPCLESVLKMSRYVNHPCYAPIHAEGCLYVCYSSISGLQLTHTHRPANLLTPTLPS